MEVWNYLEFSTDMVPKVIWSVRLLSQSLSSIWRKRAQTKSFLNRKTYVRRMIKRLRSKSGKPLNTYKKNWSSNTNILLKKSVKKWGSKSNKKKKKSANRSLEGLGKTSKITKPEKYQGFSKTKHKGYRRESRVASSRKIKRKKHNNKCRKINAKKNQGTKTQTRESCMKGGRTSLKKFLTKNN